MRENQNFTLFRGYSKEIEFAVTDASGQPFTPEVLEWHLMAWDQSLRRPTGSSLITKTLAEGNFTLSDVGMYVATVTEQETNLDAGVYYHELMCKYNDRIYLLAFGFVTINESGIPPREGWA